MKDNMIKNRKERIKALEDGIEIYVERAKVYINKGEWLTALQVLRTAAVLNEALFREQMVHDNTRDTHSHSSRG